MNSPITTTVTPIELTDAIVTAAKRVRKSKVAVEPDMPSIVDEVNANLTAGNFTQEAIANLSRVFEREFVVDDEPSPTTEEPSVPEVKAKKPRAKKVKSTIVPDSPSAGEAEEGPKAEGPNSKPVKKVRSKAKKETPVVPTEEVVEESKVEEVKVTKVKKTKAKKETPTPIEVVAPVEESKKVSKKPRAKKATVTPEETKPEETKPEEPKKEKKPRAKKVVVSVPVQEDRPSTPVLQEEEQEEGLPDLETRITDELEEEELSDIED